MTTFYIINFTNTLLTIIKQQIMSLLRQTA